MGSWRYTDGIYKDSSSVVVILNIIGLFLGLQVNILDSYPLSFSRLSHERWLHNRLVAKHIDVSYALLHGVQQTNME